MLHSCIHFYFVPRSIHGGANCNVDDNPQGLYLCLFCAARLPYNPRPTSSHAGHVGPVFCWVAIRRDRQGIRTARKCCARTRSENKRLSLTRFRSTTTPSLAQASRQITTSLLLFFTAGIDCLLMKFLGTMDLP